MADTSSAPPEDNAASRARAADDRRFIREAHARAAAFTAVPGWGTVFMGIVALGVAPFAGPPAETARWLVLWLGAAIVAAAIGMVAATRKARHVDVALTGAARRPSLAVLVAGVLAGAVLTAIFIREGWIRALPPCWLLVYGATITVAARSSVRTVRVSGAGYVVLGVIAAIIPARAGGALLAAGFGIWQIACGVLIARNHGG